MLNVFYKTKDLFETFYPKVFFKITMYAGLFLWLYYWANPESYASTIGSISPICWLLSLPFVELVIQLLAKLLPPPKIVVKDPQTKILGPFLCRPTVCSMGFWMSFWDPKQTVSIDIFQNGSLVERLQLSLRDPEYNVWMGESSKSLKSGEEYFYFVNIDGINYAPEWQSDFKFTTLSDKKNEKVNFINMSCHGKREWEKSHPAATTWNMWSILKKKHLEDPFLFAVLGGDQVYMDSQFDKYISKYDKIEKTDRIILIKEIYFDYWSAPEYQSVLCQIPTFLMWDDHDIIDGFGSRPDSFNKKELKSSWSLFQKDLEKAFFAFQAIRNPDTNSMRKNYTYTVNTPQLNILGLDLRNERNVTKQIMLSQESKDAIAEKVNTADALKPLFIVSPVTVTRISGSIEELLGQLSNTVWRYTRWLGRGKAFKKVLYWQLLFSLSFLCLQIKDSHLSNFSSSIFLVGIVISMIIAQLWRTYASKQPSEIEGKPLVAIRSTLGLFLMLGIGGIVHECSIAPFTLTGILEALKIYLIEEAHNLLWLFGLQCLGLVLVFDADKLRKSKISSRFGMVAIALSLIILIWHGLPDAHVRWNLLFFKVPLAVMSFFYLVVTILESLGAVDEIAGLDDDIKDSWSSLPNKNELIWLFSILKPLKQPVLLLCGDIHTGGLSNIRLGNKNIPQITNSPITYPPMPPLAEKVTSGLKKMPLPKEKAFAMAENAFFISKRNFGIVSVKEGKVTATYVYEDMSIPIKIELEA